MRKLLKRPTVVLIALIVLFSAGGVGYAYWTGTGSGTATGTASSGATAVLSGTIAAGLAPGVSKTVTFTATTSAAAPVKIGTIHLDSVSVDAGHSSCGTTLGTDFDMADVAQNYDVAPTGGPHTLPNTGTLVFYNRAAVNQDACKGATITLNLSATAAA